MTRLNQGNTGYILSKQISPSSSSYDHPKASISPILCAAPWWRNWFGNYSGLSSAPVIRIQASWQRQWRRPASQSVVIFFAPHHHVVLFLVLLLLIIGVLCFQRIKVFPRQTYYDNGGNQWCGRLSVSLYPPPCRNITCPCPPCCQLTSFLADATVTAYNTLRIYICDNLLFYWRWPITTQNFIILQYHWLIIHMCHNLVHEPYNVSLR